MNTPAGDTGPAGAGEAPATEAEGSCSCGAVRYRVGLPALWVAHCHCSMCRRAQGAAFVTWFGVAADRFASLGSTTHLRSHRSSPEATRRFCDQCGTPLFFESTRWPGEVHVTLASLDPAVAATLTPQAHVYWSDCVPWSAVHDDLPKKG